MTPIGLIIACIILITLAMPSSPCEEWPDCNFQCRANDVTVSRLWLGDELGSSFSAQAGGVYPCYLWAEFNNNANSPRYAVILLADLRVNGSAIQSFYNEGLCVLESIPSKSSQSFPLCNLLWTGGQEVVLSRLVLSWETARGTECSQASRRCSNRNTKCYSSQRVAVQSPLVASFSFELADCSSGSVAFSDRSTGGKGTYSYNWDFGDGSHSQEASPVHAFANSGNFTVTLQVSDQSGAASQMQQISVRGCSCRISGMDHACLEKVESYQAGFAGVSPRQIIWTVDGIETAQGYARSIDIDWSDWGPGLHDLRAYAIAGDGTNVGQCNMTVHVLVEPAATISMV